MSAFGITQKSSEQLMNQLRSMQLDSQSVGTKGSPSSEKTSTSDSQGPTFAEHLKASINQVNDTQKVADKMSLDVATGKNGNLHEAMLSMTKADLSFKMMVQVRNKALEAYSEIMRMQV